MSAPFRSDLEAARSRVEALADENEDLREEVTRLKKEARADDAAPPADPALAALTETTLERLDELSERLDADHAPVALPDPAPRRDDHVRIDDLVSVPTPAPPAGALRSVTEEELVLRDRLDLLRRRQRNAHKWMAFLFLLGVVVGVVLSSAVR